MDMKPLLAKRTAGLLPSPIRKLLPLMRLPGMISLGGGYPNPESFAFSSLTLSFKSGKAFSLQNKLLELACQYGPTDVHADLRPHLIHWHAAKDGVELKPDQIQVLNGAQEGLHIMAYLFLDEGDAVVVSEPVYPGALGAFRAFSREFIPVPVDSAGMNTHELESSLEAREKSGKPRPKFIYEVPNGHNPAGVSLSLARRRHLLALASRFNLLILEDDPYQLLSLEEGEHLPSLQALDGEKRVIRLDSFSKIFAPGLRLGYASGPPEIISYFQLYKQGLNLHTSAMAQALLAGFLENHGYEEFRGLIRANCRGYRDRRDAMVAAARRRLPGQVKFHVPSEGLFIWFELPAGYDALRMMEQDGVDLGVLLVPGGAFSTRGGLKNCMRASFSMIPPEAIDEGMARFAVMIEREEARVKSG
ncbi:MAG: PLP-dependent aminotransferase family protein [Smithellaceae bacterium]|nr:PLP-dependent aminotransferase family protein [Smithellaceae bacterium]